MLLKISEKSQQAKAFLEFAETLPFVKVVEKDKKPNVVTLKAMKNAEKGKTVTHHKSSKFLFKKLGV
jgi:antitoxin component of RelBE/YafQ-DinJ toxin-antitoxin module